MLLENYKHLPYKDANLLLHYDPDTGKLYWKMIGHHKLITKKKNININDRIYYAHHLAWLLHYKKWSKKCVRHINGDNSDNRICNLHETTMKQIAINRSWNNRGKR